MKTLSAGEAFHLQELTESSGGNEMDMKELANITEHTFQGFHRKCQNMIHQFQEELQSVIRLHQSSRTHRRIDLLEVMCSSQSSLTDQMQFRGGRAMRFGLAEGDLSNRASRMKLFQWMVMYQPRNLWYSPECGPWSAWSIIVADQLRCRDVSVSACHWPSHALGTASRKLHVLAAHYV